MRRTKLLIAVFLATASAAGAQPAPAPAATSAQVDPRAVVAEVRRVIAARYVLPERRPVLDAALAEGLRAGRYDTRDPVVLAERINEDLARAGNDRHLTFAYNPQQAAFLATGTERRPPDPEVFLRQARAANHGLTEMRVLPGNVRYLAYDGFHWAGPETAAALDNAMRFLSGGDAVIIDLRRNGGGSPEAVRYAISHFLPPDRHIVTFEMTDFEEDEPARVSTLAELPAGRMIGKPLYVLTSSGTGSAAEEFAGHVGGFRIGELIGDTTGGAGFRNTLVPVPGGFVLSVSIGRAVLASTGRDWEAVGIAPTTRTPVGQALEVAQVHALQGLMASASPERRPVLAALGDAIAARLEPRTPSLPLDAYAGAFGNRSITLDGGRLYFQRETRPRTALIPLGQNRFALDVDPTIQLEFATVGTRTTALEMGPAGGPPQGRFDRTP